ncbi:hypothetical protein BLNAU_2168 [Blattamonas nauphoetae]|uniref:Uncharacterized protein n=1 Tax=Blattamonas nauphoetae TaxID=2049346 RepID=A0ABQ9YGD9_9EUKA|nr:hypothetical protein BLNAU_2168 [Blattamonas nauphoetae]
MSERKLWSYSIPPEMTKRAIDVPISIDATVGIAADGTGWKERGWRGDDSVVTTDHECWEKEKVHSLCFARSDVRLPNTIMESPGQCCNIKSDTMKSIVGTVSPAWMDIPPKKEPNKSSVNREKFEYTCETNLNRRNAQS